MHVVILFVSTNNVKLQLMMRSLQILFAYPYHSTTVFRPGQEAGNVPYVEDSGFGTYSGEPKTIADTVSTWLSSPEKLQSMKEAALEASRPTATIDIAKDLAKMLFEEKAKQAKKAKVAKPVLVSN